MKNDRFFGTYDEWQEKAIEQAKIKHPGFIKYEICENGDLYCFSLGAYPSIIKNFVEAFK